MPTYSYVCTECGEPLEAVQSFSDPALTECPACSGRLRKVFSAVGVVFKGSGFYRTDSRAKSAGSDPGKAAKTEGGSSPAAAAGDGSGSSGSSGSSGEGTSSPKSAPAKSTPAVPAA